jgi:hypothetical protein
MMAGLIIKEGKGTTISCSYFLYKKGTTIIYIHILYLVYYMVYIYMVCGVIDSN